MKIIIGLLILSILSCFGFAQATANSATVPITLDHNRVIIDVYLRLPDGSKTRVRGWVDSGNPDLWMTEKLAQKLGLELRGEAQPALAGKQRMAQAPNEVFVGNISLSLAGIKDAHVVLDRESIAPGCSAEINLPSKLLSSYDVVVDYPNRELTVGAPGSSHFEGTAAKATVNSENGVVVLPAAIDQEAGNAILDVGATVSFLWKDVIDGLERRHPQWPHMVGAVGPANLWGLYEEPHWKLLRIAQMSFGGTELTNVVAAGFPEQFKPLIEKRVGVPIIGLIGGDALLNYKVGIDYAHSTIYLKQLSKYTPPGIDVVGLILRPEPDEHYTVIGVADYDGKPSVPEVKAGDRLISIDGGRATGATMGQVWSLLEGAPGTARTLVLEREGKQFTVKTTVRSFLPAVPVKPSRRTSRKGSSAQR